jgi:hypothetical protein
MVYLEMERCKDYPIIRKFFCEDTLNLFEEQLKQYLKMKEITEEYLQRIPPVVCWYEGMIATEEFIEEYREVELLGNNVG